MERYVKALLATAVLGLLVTIANASFAFKSKSLLERRVEILESGRKDQQLRNQGQDRLNSEVIKHLENHD
jgi:hypothetical protein